MRDFADVIGFVHRLPPFCTPNDNSGNPHHCDVGRDIAYYKGIGGNNRIVSDLHLAENLGSSINRDVVPDDRRAFRARKTDRHLVENCTIFANLDSRNMRTVAMENLKPGPDLRAAAES